MEGGGGSGGRGRLLTWKGSLLFFLYLYLNHHRLVDSDFFLYSSILHTLLPPSPKEPIFISPKNKLDENLYLLIFLFLLHLKVRFMIPSIQPTTHRCPSYLFCCIVGSCRASELLPVTDSSDSTALKYVILLFLARETLQGQTFALFKRIGDPSPAGGQS